MRRSPSAARSRKGSDSSQTARIIVASGHRTRPGPAARRSARGRRQRARWPARPRSAAPSREGRGRRGSSVGSRPDRPEPAAPQPDQPDRDTAPRGLDHPAPVDHQGDMAAGRAPAGVDHQVTRLEPARDAGQAGELAGRGPRDPHPSSPPGGKGQPRAVERARAFGRPPVRLAPLAKGVGNGPGGPRGRTSSPDRRRSRQGRQPQPRKGRPAGRGLVSQRPGMRGGKQRPAS